MHCFKSKFKKKFWEGAYPLPRPHSLVKVSDAKTRKVSKNNKIKNNTNMRATCD